MTEEIKSEANNEFIQDVTLQDLKLQFDDLAAAVAMNYRQLEQLLIFSAQQQSLLNQSVQALNQQAQILSDISRWKDPTGARIADMEINLQTVEEDVKDVIQEIQSLPTEIQSIKDAIGNIKIFRQDY